MELLPCAVGQTLDRTLAEKEGRPSWTGCTECQDSQYGLWTDSRPNLVSGEYELQDYRTLMNKTSQALVVSGACQACPPNAVCKGGAVLAPLPGECQHPYPLSAGESSSVPCEQ